MYREKAVSDAIAGVTVGLTVIPQVNLVSIVINIVLAPLLLLLLLPLFFCQVNMIITRASPMQWWLGSSLNMVFTPPSWDALPIASLAGATSRIRSQPFYKYLRIIMNSSQHERHHNRSHGDHGAHDWRSCAGPDHQNHLHHVCQCSSMDQTTQYFLPSSPG